MTKENVLETSETGNGFLFSSKLPKKEMFRSDWSAFYPSPDADSETRIDA
jgi:hypothetical protein